MQDEEFNQLLNKFVLITKRGWVKGVNNLTNGAGLTLEHLLGKKADSLFMPDYNGIELKCSTRYSRYPISLFSLAFDGPSFYETNRLLQKYGKDDDKYQDRKILLVNLKTNKKVLVNDKYFFELQVDYTDEKIYLKIYDINMNLLEKEAYIEFKTIKNRIELKLAKLALISASKKVWYGNNFFRYYMITFYKLKSFDKFLELIENNDINANLVCRVSKSGNEQGRQRNKNIVFQLPKDSISLLFEEIKCYNADEM